MEEYDDIKTNYLLAIHKKTMWHRRKNRKDQRCTFFGLVKEFSSIRLAEVSSVFVDPDSCMELSPSPSTEMLRFTVLLPKFTI